MWWTRISYVPKYIIKRIIPKDAVVNLDMNGDGKADAVGVKYVNVISPLEIPANISKQELLSQFVSVNIDSEIYTDFTKLRLWFDNEVFSFGDIDKLLGKTLPVGGFVIIIVDKPGGISAGMHKFGMKTQYNNQENYNEVEREVSADVKTLSDIVGK